MIDEKELIKALEELKFLANFNGNFEVIHRKDCLKFEIRTKENGHNEPHFHVETSDFAASYSINTYNCLSGTFPSRIEKQIIKWAKKNHEMLVEIWNSYHGDFIKAL